MSRHATYLAIVFVLRVDGPFEHRDEVLTRKACDWRKPTRDDSMFSEDCAIRLLRGDTDQRMPDCPQCAVLLDLALELRIPPEPKE